MLKNILFVFQIIVSAVLVFLIVIQSKGTGLSGSIMGKTPVYSTKRGLEKYVYYLTIGLSVVFFITSIVVLTI